MKDLVNESLALVLDFLVSLQRERVQPQEARARLQSLRERTPELSLDLLAEVEAYDGSVHYDMLVRRAGDGTVSLSYCPEPSLPWPLRGVHRWSEADLARVNGTVLKVDQAVACLDFIWNEEPITRRLINLCLIQEELEREPVSLTDGDMREAMKHFRKVKKLFTAKDTLEWLERHGLSREKLEGFVTDEILMARLRDRIAANGEEEYFRQHGTDFDRVSVARLVVANEARARELAAQIRAGELGFYTAAERCFLEEAGQGVSSPEATFAVIERRHASPELRDLLFAAAPGDLVGPVGAEAGYVLHLVIATERATLDDRTRLAIKDTIFEEWLSERRRSARIEWCWGNAGVKG
jgi:putative peptide maturation system protein